MGSKICHLTDLTQYSVSTFLHSAPPPLRLPVYPEVTLLMALYSYCYAYSQTFKLSYFTLLDSIFSCTSVRIDYKTHHVRLSSYTCMCYFYFKLAFIIKRSNNRERLLLLRLTLLHNFY